MEIWTIFVAAGIPSAVCALLIWFIERKISKIDRRREQEQEELRKEAKEKEERNEKFMLSLLETTSAALVLSEATARAVQRIPDAKCNGDMHKALETAEKLQQKQHEFLTELGLHSIYSGS